MSCRAPVNEHGAQSPPMPLATLLLILLSHSPQNQVFSFDPSTIHLRNRRTGWRWISRHRCASKPQGTDGANFTFSKVIQHSIVVICTAIIQRHRKWVARAVRRTEVGSIGGQSWIAEVCCVGGLQMTVEKVSTTTKVSNEGQQRRSRAKVSNEGQQRRSGAKVSNEGRERRSAAKVCSEGQQRRSATKVWSEGLERRLATKVCSEGQLRRSATKVQVDS